MSLQVQRLYIDLFVYSIFDIIINIRCNKVGFHFFCFFYRFLIIIFLFFTSFSIKKSNVISYHNEIHD